MTYRRLFVILCVTLMAFTLSCPKKITGIKGTLILQTGQAGDVRNSRVQLFVSSDLTGNPVKEVASDATGVDQTKSKFEFEDVLPQYYYLLAWKDLNGNGKVDHLDIVGVHGGKYKPGYGGTQITVTEGKMTDVGEIVMYIYKELLMTVRTERDANGFLSFIYKFNDDCVVTSWSFTGPGGIQASDPDQNGSKTANTEYRSEWWAYNNGPMPSGNYTITAVTTYEGASVTVTATINVP